MSGVGSPKSKPTATSAVFGFLWRAKTAVAVSAISENGRAVLFEALIAVDGERFFSFDTVRNRGIEVL